MMSVTPASPGATAKEEREKVGEGIAKNAPAANGQDNKDDSS
jgi:hypothetical protein